MLICFVLLCPPKFMKIPLALALIVSQFSDVPKTKTAAFTTPSAICGGGFFTEKIKDKLTPLVKSAIETIINDKVKANLDTALKSTQKTQEEISEQQQTDASEEDHDGVVTTQEEIDACNIVRAIAAEIIDPHRVAMRDVKSYCSILFDDNNRRPICRLYFNNADRKMISIFDTPQEEKTTLADLPELFKMKERIHNAIRRYLADPEAGSSPAQAE